MTAQLSLLGIARDRQDRATPRAAASPAFLSRTLVEADLPERVRVLPFWQPYGGLAVDGQKTIETRVYAAPADLGFLVVHASLTVDHEVVASLGERAVPYYSRTARGRLVAAHGGHLLGQGRQGFWSVARSVVLHALGGAS